MAEKRLLEGLKVLDFAWVIVGPCVTKFLADHGATVIRVESHSRVDNYRSHQPNKDGVRGINRSGTWAALNAGKYGMALNMERPEAREVAKRLAAWCDVLVENYVPGTIAKWGLGYEDVKRLNEDIIMLSMSSLGQTGPLAEFHGLGYHLMGFGGFSHVTGFPDSEPLGNMPYTDFAAPPFGVAALMAALDRRRRTGKGTHIDLSQVEASIHFLGPAVLDRTVNGRDARRVGNASPYAAPHGAYRCEGEERWCAIAVFTDAHWDAFQHALGDPPWAGDSRFSTVMGRLSRQTELDRHVEEWGPSSTLRKRSWNGFRPSVSQRWWSRRAWTWPRTRSSPSGGSFPSSRTQRWRG